MSDGSRPFTSLGGIMDGGPKPHRQVFVDRRWKGIFVTIPSLSLATVSAWLTLAGWTDEGAGWFVLFCSVYTVICGILAVFGIAMLLRPVILCLKPEGFSLQFPFRRCVDVPWSDVESFIIVRRPYIHFREVGWLYRIDRGPPRSRSMGRAFGADAVIPLGGSVSADRLIGIMQAHHRHHGLADAIASQAASDPQG